MNSLIPVALIVLAFFAAEPVESIQFFKRKKRTWNDKPTFSSRIKRNVIESKWIEQKLNHFDERENPTWKMRYMENRNYFKNGGPIFINVGGEWSITREVLLGGYMHDLAKEHKGYMYCVEHRYYGESYPTKDLSTDNLKYLNARQALADLAHFIRNITATVPELNNSAVILVGASYAGGLVTWFKRLYPELATGCWASSPAILAKNDFYEYREVTGESIKLVGGELCYSRIRNGFAQLEDMIENNHSEEIHSLLGICDSFNSSKDMDVWYLFSELYDIFGNIVQYHSNRDIQEVCEKILTGDDDLIGLSRFLRSSLQKKPCKDMSYRAALELLTNTSLNIGLTRQWIYQSCNEFGIHPTTTSLNQPFGKNAPLEGYIKNCANLFDNQFNITVFKRRIEKTNEFFGGLNPNVSDVYMTQGQLDPCRDLGIQDPRKIQIIPMTSHCQDMDSINESDSPEMRRCKKKLAKLVRKWVKSTK